MTLSTALSAFEINQLTAGYLEHTVLNNISLSIPKGKLTAVIGPNGCGKSTLLKCLSRLLPVKNGSICLEGEPMDKIGRKVLAQILTSLPQQPQSPQGITVFDLVARGRTPYQGIFSQWSYEDQMAVEASLEQVSLTDNAAALVDQLSGGQRQRVWIAMTLAQQTKTILLDEPTASLDPRHQIDIFDLLRKLCHEENKTIVVVVHDLNMALQFADYVVVLREGQVIKADTAELALTPEVIQAAFDLECEVVRATSRSCRAIIPFV